MDELQFEELMKQYGNEVPMPEAGAPMPVSTISEPDMSRYDSEIAKAKDEAERQRKMSYIAQAMQGIGTAHAVSRGMKPLSTGIYEEMRQTADRPVAEALGSKEQALKNWYRAKDLEHKAKQAEYTNALKEKWAAERAQTAAERKAKAESDTAFQQDITRTNQQIRQSEIARDIANKEESKAEKLAEKEAALTVEGYGKARTPKEAQDLRQSVIDTKSALDDLRSVKELGNNVAIWDRTKVNKIDQLLGQAVGKLRLSMVGPGAMTESERLMIRESIGDPTALFSSESIQQAKLDQLISTLEKRLEDEAKAKVVGYGGKESNQGTGAANKTVVKKEINQKLGKTRVTYSDGSTEVLDGIQ